MTLWRSMSLSLRAVLAVAVMVGMFFAWPAARLVVAAVAALAGWVLVVVVWVHWRILRDELRAERALASQRLDEKLRLEKRLAQADTQAFARGRLSAKTEAGL
jgi:uncharacterized membrane protein YccC